MSSHPVHLSVEIQCVLANIMLVSALSNGLYISWVQCESFTLYCPLHMQRVLTKCGGNERESERSHLSLKSKKNSVFVAMLYIQSAITKANTSLSYFVKINIFLKFVTTVFHILCNI